PNLIFPFTTLPRAGDEGGARSRVALPALAHPSGRAQSARRCPPSRITRRLLRHCEVLQLDLHGHGACDLAPDLADLTMVLHLPGRLLEAHLEELAPLLTEVLVELCVVHVAQHLDGLGPFAHAGASTSAPDSS